MERTTFATILSPEPMARTGHFINIWWMNERRSSALFREELYSVEDKPRAVLGEVW